MKFTAQQEQALKDLVSWWENPKADPVFMLCGFAGSGKAQPLDTLVQTPLGPRKLGDLVVGDSVFSADGTICEVTGVYPQGVRPCYRLKFRDGSSTRCDESHLWSIKPSSKPYRVVDTKYLASTTLKTPCGIWRFQIPLAKPVEYPKKDLPIDPYLMGVLLGDGSLSGHSIGITLGLHKKPILDRISNCLPEGTKLGSVLVTDSVILITLMKEGEEYRSKLITTISEFGLRVTSKEKFIPRMYLESSVEDRLELLRGLMDTDGSCSVGNRTSFYTSSLQLRKDVMELVQSLGGTAISGEPPADRPDQYGINVKMFVNPFWLECKASNWKCSKKNPPSRMLREIEFLGEVEQRCISVSHPSKLYLTDEFIVTHNTTVMKEALSRLSGCEPLLTAPTGKAAKVLATKSEKEATTIHRALYKPSDPVRSKLKLQLTNAWSSLRNGDFLGENRTEEDVRKEIKVLEDKLLSMKKDSSRFSLSGKTSEFNLLLVDECSMVNEFMARDLEKISKKLLLVGDPFQLPPVKAKWGWEGRNPDVMLTQVVRQSGDGAGITLAAEAIRKGLEPKTGMGFEMYSKGILTFHDYMEFDVVLVGSNHMKRTLDQGIRKRKGLEFGVPTEGEKVMCLANKSEYGVFNGEVFTIKEVKGVDRRHNIVVLDLIDELGEEYYELECDLRLFEDHQNTHKVPEDILQFTFAYASTVHKYQGSEASNVCLIDDWNRGEHDRWLYTGITRAVDHCSLVR